LKVAEIFSRAEQSRLLSEAHPKRIWELANDDSLFQKSPDQLAALRLDLSRSALQFFRHHSEFYAELFEQLNIDPKNAGLEDLAKLCIPADMLRGEGQQQFLIRDIEAGGKHFTSSGTTSQTPVRIYRSPLDLAVMINANTRLFEHVYGGTLEQAKGIALFMAAEELRDMLNFVSFVDMTLESKGIELIYGMDLVPGDDTIWKRLKPNRDRLIKFLKSKKEPKLFFTAPAGVHLLCDQFETMPLTKKIGMKLMANAPPIAPSPASA
jgi:phenylacetate-CoA ligase